MGTGSQLVLAVLHEPSAARTVSLKPIPKAGRT